MKGQYQTVAQKESLSTEPRNVLPGNTAKPNTQKIGTSIPLQMSPTAVKMGSGTSNGEFQMVGTPLKLNKTPQVGYESANLPMSNRAVDGKKLY